MCNSVVMYIRGHYALLISSPLVQRWPASAETRSPLIFHHVLPAQYIFSCFPSLNTSWIDTSPYENLLITCHKVNVHYNPLLSISTAVIWSSMTWCI